MVNGEWHALAPLHCIIHTLRQQTLEYYGKPTILQSSLVSFQTAHIQKTKPEL